MEMHVVYTFSDVLFEEEKMPPGLSSLQRGEDGFYGLAIEPHVDLFTETTTCTFFEINMPEKRISHREIHLPYTSLYRIDIIYDRPTKTWKVVLGINAYRFPVEVYELLFASETPWRRVFQDNNQENEERDLLAFWQHDVDASMLFCAEDVTRMYDSHVWLVQWNTASLETSLSVPLGLHYTWLPFLHEEGFLFFSCQCLYDHLERDPVYWKKGTGQWRIGVTVYDDDHARLSQDLLPDISFPVRDVEVARYDLLHWLKLQMQAIAGPPAGLERKPTCIVALVMLDQPGYLEFTIRKQLPHEPLPPQGGLYWFDMQGHVLQKDLSLHGDQISMCLCGDRVVGTHVQQDGQRPLWIWSPRSGEGHTVLSFVPTEVKRATVVAMDEQERGEATWFWCVEEYETGVRVTQRAMDHFQERQAFWYEGMSVPDYRLGPYLWDQQPRGIVAYEDTLLILAINEAKQLQLLQFQ